MTKIRKKTVFRHNFTLLELLLICAATTLLAVLLHAAAAAADHAAQCSANLEVWGRQIAVYAEANDGYFIPQALKAVNRSKFETWNSFLSPLRKEVAPQVSFSVWQAGNSVNGCPDAPAKNRLNSIAHNTGLMGHYHAGAPDMHRLTALAEPGKFIAFADARANNISPGNYERESGDKRLALRHRNNSAVNAVFADGHTELRSDRDIDSRNAPQEVRALFSPFYAGIPAW